MDEQNPAVARAQATHRLNKAVEHPKLASVKEGIDRFLVPSTADRQAMRSARNTRFSSNLLQV